jgi:hypothetical protein
VFHRLLTRSGLNCCTALPNHAFKTHRPYEFGVKVSVATTLARSKGGQFIAHVKALPGNPYDGHTLETSFRRSRPRSARALLASSPTAATAATTPRPTTR